MIDRAVAAVKGRSALIAAPAKAEFPLVRGPFKYNTNHFPIENFYLLKAVQAGGDIEMQIQKTVFENHKDSYYKDCGMKW